MNRSWRIYVGAEVPASATSAGGSSTQELLDTAFARRAQFTLQSTPQAVRQRPSAAASPVLRWLLQMENKQTTETVPMVGVPSASQGGAAKANSSTSPHHKEASISEILSGNEAGSASMLPPAPTVAATALMRRGVGPKDPLLQRRLKKQQQAKSTATTAPVQTNTPTRSRITSSHWSQHPYSAMTPTSWRVFRQQLGITVELVAPAITGAPAKPSSAVSPAVLPSTVLPAAETLPAIRCWEEAQLPLSLGRCVTANYALPTAVQTQCVPLALLASPVSLSAATEAVTVTASSLGMDVLAVAETGSGKTAAYLVPLLSHVLCRAPKLLGYPDRISLGPLSLVMVPTRELAEQVVASLLRLVGQAGSTAPASPISPAAAVAPTTGVRLANIIAWEAEENNLSSKNTNASVRNCLSEFRVVKVVGGESRDAQYNALAQGAHCVVGTVGQLQTLLEDRMLSLGNTQFVVVDEADRMIDEQQEAKLFAVFERCPTPRQTLMFTATLSGSCASVAKRYLSKSGYYLVRAPYCCASIRQSFELIPDTTTTYAVEDQGSTSARLQKPPRQQRKQENTDKPSENDIGQQQQRQQRVLHSRIHPQKFARLVTWLVYATGPIIVFANEKVTCDALFEELRAEAEQLDAQQEYFTLPDLVGPPPDGLVFREGTEISLPTSRTTTAAAAMPCNPSLLNLTSVAVVHSELSQNERRSLVAQFQRRQRQVLITTDLLARGLDVVGVTLVVNYDVPWSVTGMAADAMTLYIHRIGRTGRAGSTGLAVTFVELPAAMVQRAEEVVKEAEKSQQQTSKANDGDHTEGVNKNRTSAFSGARAQTTGLTSSTAAVKADNADDPMSLMGELFDGDTQNVWVTGVSAAVAGSGRKRRNGDSEDDEEEVRVDMNDRDDGTESERTRLNNRRAKPRTGFGSDVDVLRHMWSFLIECAEGEGCKDGAAALRRGTYAKISVPPALACIMAQLSATSQFGRITL